MTITISNEFRPRSLLTAMHTPKNGAHWRSQCHRLAGDRPAAPQADRRRLGLSTSVATIPTFSSRTARASAAEQEDLQQDVHHKIHGGHVVVVDDDPVRGLGRFAGGYPDQELL